MAAIHLAEYVKRKGLDPAACDIRFGLDPLGACAVWGSSPYSWAEIVPAVTGAIKGLAAMGFKGPFAVADGRVIHDAGGSEAQELAFVLAAGVAYLRAIESAGVALEDAQGMVYARLSADADQFLTLAKFRALRLLWARVEQACGLTPKPLFIAADTAWRMLTQRDPYVNMLRATMATFSAGLGGANAITVLPHTLALGLPDPFARRVARNTQLVLLEESNLAKVSDPAAGSGGIETLTQAALRSRMVAVPGDREGRRRVRRARAKPDPAQGRGDAGGARDQHRQAQGRADRRQRISQSARGRGRGARREAGRASRPMAKPNSNSIALAPMRLAAPFEALRDQSDRNPQGSRRAAKSLSRQSRHARRLHRARHLCQELLRDRRHRGDRHRRIYRPGGARRRLQGVRRGLACLCSSDKVYAEQAAAAAKALQAAGARHIYLAGRPGEQEAALRAAGVSDFIFAGGDALAMLQEA